MKILVCSTSYPTLDGKRAMNYVHSRCLYYVQNGFDVVVLNFSCKYKYQYEGINVISINEYSVSPTEADIIICHAPNIKNHYFFLKRYGKLYEEIIFCFHGHEVLHINNYYPKPFEYKYNSFKYFFQKYYDDFKIVLWKKYFINNRNKCYFIFVSDWLKNAFFKEFSLEESKFDDKVEVISNGVGYFFEQNTYKKKNRKYDFITIRQYIDEKNYCIDVVRKLALLYPAYSFCLIGKGQYFNHYSLPNNIDFIEKELTHIEMKEYIDSAKFALLPTRHDTQGLMACELATYGIPLITSDIPICKEIFDTCPNVFFINNNHPSLDFIDCAFSFPTQKWTKYFAKNTILKEISFIEGVTKEKGKIKK